MATKENYQASMDTLRQQMHIIVDQLCNHALAAGLVGMTEEKQKKPLNDLKPDPASQASQEGHRLSRPKCAASAAGR